MNIPQLIGLFVYVATAAIFSGALANIVLAGPDTVQEFAVAFSYLVAIVALVVMFIDIYDLWIRGRRLSKAATRGMKMVVMVAIVGSMATALLGGNTTLVIFLLPSIIIYYMTMRPQPATTRGVSSGRRAGTTSAPSKSRQRRGGKKRR
jgi:hypothetical protein